MPTDRSVFGRGITWSKIFGPPPHRSVRRRCIIDVSIYAYASKYIFICIPFVILVHHSRAPSPSSNLDPGSHSGYLLLPPHYGKCLHFYRENNSACFLPSGRLAST